MAAAGPWVLYNEFNEYKSDGTIDLDNDQFMVALFKSNSNCGDATLTPATYGNLTNEVDEQYGYLTGGVVCAATWVRAGAAVTFDLANASWTASGGDIVARFAVIYSDTATSKNCVAYCLLDSTPADVTCANGNTMEIVISNVFTDTIPPRT